MQDSRGLRLKAEPAKEKRHSFIADIEEIRRRAREHMEKSAVTEDYKADRETVLRVLNGSGDGNCLCAALQTPLLHGRRMRSFGAGALSSEEPHEGCT